MADLRLLRVPISTPRALLLLVYLPRTHLELVRSRTAVVAKSLVVLTPRVLTLLALTPRVLFLAARTFLSPPSPLLLLQQAMGLIPTLL